MPSLKALKLDFPARAELLSFSIAVVKQGYYLKFV